jgi:tRNA (cmo5U34)-methyltransferase
MPRDRIYGEPKNPVPPFQFDEQVVSVFDDMLTRSIPLYREIIRRQVQLIDRFYQDGTHIYDLGCSNGNLGVAVCRSMRSRHFEMIAVDNSRPMIDAYGARLEKARHAGRITLRCGDICGLKMNQASVVALNFTLQFIARDHRDALVGRIFEALMPNGIFLFCEKITHPDGAVAELQQTMYYDFKKENGYSDLEISQKRDALEKVLVPETLEGHLERLGRAGFRIVDVWLKWFNFAAMVAVK